LNQRFSTGRYQIRRCRFGLGVFAVRDIAPGEVILPLEGPLIDFAETIRRGPRECMAIQIGLNEYIDTQPPAVWVNHACVPNSGIKADRQLIAIQPIRKGEQVCYDYSTTMEEAFFTMECLCGTPRCRRVVQDFSTLPPGLQRKYLSQGIVMGFILRGRGAQSQRLAEVTIRRPQAARGPLVRQPALAEDMDWRPGDDR
jgi:hypothetical protein